MLGLGLAATGCGSSEVLKPGESFQSGDCEYKLVEASLRHEGATWDGAATVQVRSAVTDNFADCSFSLELANASGDRIERNADVEEFLTTTEKEDHHFISPGSRGGYTSSYLEKLQPGGQGPRCLTVHVTSHIKLEGVQLQLVGYGGGLFLQKTRKVDARVATSGLDQAKTHPPLKDKHFSFGLNGYRECP